jgi:hypothetical protein
MEHGYRFDFIRQEWDDLEDQSALNAPLPDLSCEYPSAYCEPLFYTDRLVNFDW